MKQILREPLLHFLVLGAALFAMFSFWQQERASREEQIVVSADKIDYIAALFERTWQRPPTPEELDGLIKDFVREEAAYREGLALGLDRDDTIIRRRIRQKLDFIAQDLAGQAEPADADLTAYPPPVTSLTSSARRLRQRSPHWSLVSGRGRSPRAMACTW